jgi:ATP-dependent exoDNAse (exonuclease V) beta subunit
MMFEKYLALHASAGSGKTYALSVRYISLLYLGASPSKILTLTFTNKAASEMKSRIFETLVNLEEKNELEDISLQVGISKEEIIKRKGNILKRFLNEDLSISTIDSFFASILRKFSLHAGIMPDFGIESSLVDTNLVEKFLRICIQNKKYDSLIRFALHEEQKLSSVFELLDSFYQKEGEFDASLFPKAHLANSEKVFELLEALKEHFIKCNASTRAINTFTCKDISELLGKGFLQKESLAYWDYKKHVNDAVEELFFALKEELQVYLQRREAYILGELGDLYSIYKSTLRVLNKELSTLSFSDVTNIIYSLLQNEITKEFLYFRLDGKIEHMLIDEFQDTNVLQFKILEPLMQEIVSGVGIKEFKSLFFVGDIKQSIYRFRGGAKELFEHSVKEFRVKRDILDTNYRSSLNVVEFVNDTFGDLIKGYERQKVNSDAIGYVNVTQVDDIQALIVKNINSLLSHGVTCKDIAILVHQNKDAKSIQELLLKEIEGVKVQTEATLKLIQVPMVQGVLNLLKYAYFQEELYAKNFLALCGEDFREDVVISWLDLNLPPAKIIIEVVRRYKLFSQDLDIIKLVEVASRYSDIESFLFECDTLSDEAKSEDNDGIKILTIHKSKGLEFEHVLVVDRLQAPNNRSDTLLYEYEDIHLKALYQRVKNREYLDERYQEAKAKEKMLEEEDKLNVYYVAFTRAKSSLMICSKKEGSAFELLGLSPMTKGEIQTKQTTHKQVDLVKMEENFTRFGSQKQELVEEEKEGNNFYASQYGLAMHYCLEMMRDFSKESLELAYKAMYNRYLLLLGQRALLEIKKRIVHLLESEEFSKIIKDAKRVLKEQPLIYNGQRKQIDLLIEKESEVFILDYKSSANIQEEHLQQVALYKNALREIYNLPVVAYLCYIREEGVEFKNL